MTTRKTILCALLLGALGACDSRPSESACEKAVENIRKLTGQSQTEVGADPKAAIRSCRAQSDKDTVECMAEAPTQEKLFACGGEFAETIKKMTLDKARTPEPSAGSEPGTDK